jgi:SAM-dependent methyltransferase
MASPAHYDSLAPFYDTVIGANNSAKKFLLSASKKILNKDSKILELGCGTAENLSLFKNYAVTGIDISEGMLKLARKKIPAGKFLKGNISDFNLNKKFDLIICLYDTINHLENFKSWAQLFKCVKAHLSKNGVFIFDFNTLYKLNILSESDIYPEFSGEDTLLLDVKKESKNLFNWNIKYFRHISAARYELVESNIPESSFEKEKIFKELEKNFIITKTCSENFKKVTKNSLRIFCVAKLKQF